MSNRRDFIKKMTVGAGLALAANKIVLGQENISTEGVTAGNQPLKIISLDRLELEAKEVLSPANYAFISGGRGSEWTLRENRSAFNDYQILTHRLGDITLDNIDTKLNLLGIDLDFPIISAPAGVHAFASREAEIGSVKGVSASNTLFTSSGASGRTLEEIAAASSGPKWFQIYYNNDVAVNRDILRRAKAAGYQAIVLTVDAIGPGASDGFLSLGAPFREGVTFANNDPQFGGIGNFRNQKANLTSDDIKFIIKETNLPVIVKGVLRGKDADEAIKAGASAIQVSNHGGRQLDGVPAAISVLEEVVQAVDKRVPVIFDSGIRNGPDIFKALCLGATAVAVGRPMLYGLAVGGASGVQSVFEFLQEDFRLTMLLAGARTLKDLSPEYIKYRNA